MREHAIFICYRRDDTADVAGRVYDALARKFGARRVFKDVDAIPPGADFGNYIQKVLPTCRSFLVLIGPHWLGARDEDGARRLDNPNDWVRLEIETALATKRLEVVPVLINGANMPRAEDLPESLRPLSRLNAATIRRDPDFHDDARRLTGAIERGMRSDVSSAPVEMIAAPTDGPKPRLIEGRARWLALGLAAVLVLLSARVVQITFFSERFLDTPAIAAVANPTERAELVDRNGVLLATTVRSYVLTAEPSRIDDAARTTSRLLAVLPDMSAITTERRMLNTERRLVFLRRGLTPTQRNQIQALDLRGIGFETEWRRVYTYAPRAAHVIGFTSVDLDPLAGAELGLDEQILAAGAEGRAVVLSLDIRVQEVVEAELEAAALAAGAQGGAAIVLDGQTGEILAHASWPTFDANGPRDDQERMRDRASGDVREPGALMYPFTTAMALDREASYPSETLDLSQLPRTWSGRDASVRPADVVAQDSAAGAAALALRVGGVAQRDYLWRMGFLQSAATEVGRNQPALAPISEQQEQVASTGAGHGVAVTLLAIAGAYTAFVNAGSRTNLTLLRRNEAPNDVTPVFSGAVRNEVLSYLRQSAGSRAAAPVGALDIPVAGMLDGRMGHDGRIFSSFAGVFPAREPRFVIAVALDEVQGDSSAEVSAPAAKAMIMRIAPSLGIMASE